MVTRIGYLVTTSLPSQKPCYLWDRTLNAVIGSAAKTLFKSSLESRP